MSKIIIADGKTGNILDRIYQKDVTFNDHVRNMSTWVETFDFIAFASKEKRYVKHLLDRNRLIIPDEDGKYRELIIKRIEKYSSGGVNYIDIGSYGFYQDLITAKVIDPHTTPSQSAEVHARNILASTGVQVGNIAYTKDQSMEYENHTDPFAALKRIASEFDLELDFRIEIEKGKVIRYADLVERIGTWRGRTIEFGKDLQSIRRKSDSANIVTALRVLGPEQENGDRLEVFVEDEDARNRWSKDGEHLVKIYEPQTDNEDITKERLEQLGRQELNKRIDAVVTWEAEIVDLEHVPGLENKKIRYGDTQRIKDTSFNPPIFVEARAFMIGGDIFVRDKKRIELGAFIEFTVEQVRDVWKSLQEEIQKKLEKLVLATIVSSAGSVFKNGVGSTELEAKTFLGGMEVDQDGTKYEYRWYKYDKNGEFIYSFRETGKKINVTASSIDEKASYTVEILLNDEVLTLSQITLSNVFDGEDGKDGYTPQKGTDYFDGTDGQDGRSSYLWVRYSQNANGNPMTTDPTNAKYIGVATTTEPSAPTSYTAYTWSLVKGSDGIPGEDGSDGRTSYLHIKYSNDGGKTFTGNNGETVGDWIGTYVDFNSADSNNVSSYTWNKVKGEKGDKGEQGVPGVPGPDGKDGQSLYTWVKYATNANGANMSDLPDGRSYIGLAYNKPTPVESNNASDYQWAKIEGDQGVKGSDGVTTYTWLKYADTPTSGMSDSPADKLYMGLAYNKTTSTESTNYVDYSWSLIKGEKGDKGEQGDRGLQGIQGPEGDQGIPGAKGADGLTAYTHIAYADTASGGGFSQNPNGKAYIGMYVDHNATDSTDPSKYKWSLIKGADGAKGTPGTPGADGRTPYFHTAWANNITGTSGFSTTVSVGKTHIGTYTDFTQADSTNPALYNWSQIKGDKGDKGDEGDTGAKGDKGEKGADGKPNLVNNPNYSGNVNNWNGSSAPSLATRAFVDGKSIKVLSHTSTGSHSIITTKFEIDSSKMYEVSIWLQSSVSTGSVYVGHYAYNSAGTNIGSFRIPTNTGIKGAVNTNPYGASGYTASTAWKKHTYYLLPAGLNVSDARLTMGLGENNNWNFQLSADTTHLTMRWLNWSNSASAPKTVYGALPIVQEVDVGILEANKAKHHADNAQASADGKNTVFRQNTQPSTANRKIGDLWFDTGNGNRMYVWTGSWTLTKLDYQALAVGQLSAISADLGNVTAGELVGVIIETSGTEGTINLQNDEVTSRKIISSVRYVEAKLQSGGLVVQSNLDDAGRYHKGTLIQDNGVNVFDEGKSNTYGASYGIDGIDIDLGTSPRYRLATAWGTGYFGARNTSNFHMDTDRPSFYMYKPLTVNGNLTLAGSNVVSQKAYGVLNLQNGWENYGGSFMLARYVRQSDDMVYLMGVIRRGTLNATVATLPVGSRPLQTEIFAAGESPNGNGRIYVYADGRITVSLGGTGFISLSGISFKVGG